MNFFATRWCWTLGVEKEKKTCSVFFGSGGKLWKIEGESCFYLCNAVRRKRFGVWRNGGFSENRMTTGWCAKKKVEECFSVIFFLLSILLSRISPTKILPRLRPSTVNPGSSTRPGWTWRPPMRRPRLPSRRQPRLPDQPIRWRPALPRAAGGVDCWVRAVTQKKNDLKDGSVGDHPFYYLRNNCLVTLDSCKRNLATDLGVRDYIVGFDQSNLSTWAPLHFSTWPLQTDQLMEESSFEGIRS